MGYPNLQSNGYIRPPIQMNQYEPTTTTSQGDFLQSTQCNRTEQLPYYPFYNSSGKLNQNPNFLNDLQSKHWTTFKTKEFSTIK